MTTEIALPANGWQPRPYQQAAWKHLEQGGKRTYLVWHRRAGKDELAMQAEAVAAWSRVGTYWHLLPEASQARKAIWEAVNPHTGRRRIDEAFPPELRATTRENEMLIRFKNESTWQVIGSDNYDSLVGSSVVGVTFSEWALADPNAWAYIRPILKENKGWALFITTPRGQNHAAEMYDSVAEDPEWFTQVLPATKTDVFNAVELKQELKEYEQQFGTDLGRGRYEQEYLCSFQGAVIGAVYAKEMAEAEREGRITTVPHDKAHSVSTSWDLGRADTTAIWFWQNIGFQCRAIDYYESSGVDLSHYAKVLQDKAYVYDEHYLPHDAGHKRLGMHERSIEQQLRELSVHPITVVPSPPGSVQAGIQAVRSGFSKIVFDREKTQRGRSALTQYHYEYNEKDKTLQMKPKHDWASNGADAMRTYFMADAGGRTEYVDIQMNTDWVA